MRRTLASVAALSCLVLATACSADRASGDGSSAAAEPSASVEPSDSAEPSESAEPSGPAARAAQRIDVTFAGDSVTPSGERVDVSAGEPVELVVTADAPGEIHVHSSPERELTYGVGTTRLRFTIDAPGVVDVESHDLGLTIVQLEVR